MKSFLKKALLMFCLCICAAAGFSGSREQAFPANPKTKHMAPLQYHFIIVSQDISGTFWKTLKAGADKAGADMNAAVELTGPVTQNEAEELKYLDIAIASKVDGIAVYVTDETKFTPLINKAVQNKIPVITIESDDKKSKRLMYVGPDIYQVGLSEASLVARTESGDSNVALILGGNYVENKDASDSLLAGFRESISHYPEIKLKQVLNANTGYFGAEKIIRNIIYNSPEINTVVCTSEADTLEIVQVLVDLNKTGSINVIGYSNSQQIRNYIKNGDIVGSVYENPNKTGYESIWNLVNLTNNKPVLPPVDKGVNTITRNNLVNYPGGS